MQVVFFFFLRYWKVSQLAFLDFTNVNKAKSMKHVWNKYTFLFSIIDKCKKAISPSREKELLMINKPNKCTHSHKIYPSFLHVPPKKQALPAALGKRPCFHKLRALSGLSRKQRSCFISQACKTNIKAMNLNSFAAWLNRFFLHVAAVAYCSSASSHTS